MEVPIDFGERSDADATSDLRSDAHSRSARCPALKTVGVGSTMPLRSAQVQLDVKAEGKPLAAGEAMPRAEFRTASPEYFRAAGIPLLGAASSRRPINAKSGTVVILNKTLADKLFPGRDPIGQRVAWTGDVLRFIGISGEWRTVVGVVGDTKDGGLDAEPRGRHVPAVRAGARCSGGGLVIRAAAAIRRAHRRRRRASCAASRRRIRSRTC